MVATAPTTAATAQIPQIVVIHPITHPIIHPIIHLTLPLILDQETLITTHQKIVRIVDK